MCVCVCVRACVGGGCYISIAYQKIHYKTIYKQI